MKIGTITFHGSHNYGSMLQAYALQECIKNIMKDYGVPCDYQILNFRSESQKDIYQLPKPEDIKSLIKWLMYRKYKAQLDIQYQKFESFISEYLQVTDEFTDSTYLPELTSSFDILFAGSDQIWNVRAKDFDNAYLLPGCKTRRISYAASLGPLSIDWDQYQTDVYKSSIDGFSILSVREKKSQELLQQVLGNKRIEIMPDPTLLLPIQEWRGIQSNMNPGEYIFFYCLEPQREHIKIAKQLSERLKLPVVTTRYRNRYDFINPFIKQYDSGPCDFLSLIDHAAVVLTSSFHGTIFSLIYGKPFYVINGIEDGRIRDVLKLFGAEKNNLPFGIQDAEPPLTVRNTEAVIRSEQEKARAYLISALGLSTVDNR